MASVLIRKEDRYTLRQYDKLKLSKSAREGVEDKFSFVETDGKLGSGFKTFYDLYMWMYDFSIVLKFYDMDDIFISFQELPFWSSRRTCQHYLIAKNY